MTTTTTMELIGWDTTPHWTRYRVKYANHIYLYHRLHPLRTIRLNGGHPFLDMLWWLTASIGHTGEERPQVDQLEHLHQKRVLEPAPRLALSLHEHLGNTDVVRMIIGLYTTIKM